MKNNTDKSDLIYCNSLTSYSRFKARIVNIGNVPLGGDNPIRIQSMTNIDTMNTIGNVEQAIRMINAGCEYVRITSSNIKEAENLKNIKNELRKRGYNVPLIADVHFNPKAAEIAASIVEKVRINPGNYVDRKENAKLKYTDKEYDYEIEKIKNRITPLIKICKQHNTAIRIGSNHGSLSQRIMNRYGNTPLGMVEAAMEFVCICEELNFYNIVLSMKASNTKTMIQACRLLQNRMIKHGIIYPQHLGVTEAGQGDDARIKSAAGIGALLEDGIGNTIRVSLTEKPELEIPVAKTLINRYSKRINKPVEKRPAQIITSPFSYKRRKTLNIKNTGSKNVPVVIADISDKDKAFFNSEDELKMMFKEIGYNKKNNKWLKNNRACDYLYIGKQKIKFTHPDSLYLIQDNDIFDKSKNNVFPLFQGEEYFRCDKKSDKINFVNITLKNLNDKFINKIKTDPTAVLIFEIQAKDKVRGQRKMFFKLINNNSETPVIIKIKYNELNKKQFQLYSSIDFATLLIDGLGDGIWIKTDKKYDLNFINNTCFKILQATGNRFSQTEYISCPSCGRTLFNIEKTLTEIRKHTHHLKGLKIGIMGCIVNGPGEMNDIDYGYVGSGKNKITLYKKDQIVKKNIDEKYAVDQLINIIKENGDWIDEKI